MDLVIGDIHGCWEELQELLQKVGPGATDRIVSVGDMVDRGPESRRVLEWFRTTPNAQALMGNHERKHIRSFEGSVKPALSQTIVREELGADYPAFVDLMRPLPLWMETPAALIVHAFFEPGIPLEQQRDNVLCGTLTGEMHLRRNYPRPWYELYEGRPIVVGHHNHHRTSEPFVHRDLVYGVDTSVYRGLALTGIVLPEFRFVSVPARRDWWKEAKDRWRGVRPASPVTVTVTWQRLRAIAAGRGAGAEAAARTLDAEAATVDCLVDVVHRLVREWVGGADAREAARVVQERIGGERTLTGVFHAARRGGLTAATIFERCPDPAELRRLLAAVAALPGSGPIPGGAPDSAPDEADGADGSED